MLFLLQIHLDFYYVTTTITRDRKQLSWTLCDMIFKVSINIQYAYIIDHPIN